MAAEQGKNKSKNTKYSYGQNYRRNRTETKFDTLTLANQLKHKVSVYVMNETYTKVVPVDKVVLMADLYCAPELITGYCMRECPVHGFLPLATEEKSIQGIALRLLKGFNEDELKAMKVDLIEITEDGIISQEEIPKLKEILNKLDGMAEVISEMKIAGEKYLKNS